MFNPTTLKSGGIFGIFVAGVAIYGERLAVLWAAAAAPMPVHPAEVGEQQRQPARHPLPTPDFVAAACAGMLAEMYGRSILPVFPLAPINRIATGEAQCHAAHRTVFAPARRGACRLGTEGSLMHHQLCRNVPLHSRPHGRLWHQENCVRCGGGRGQGMSWRLRPLLLRIAAICALNFVCCITLQLMPPALSCATETRCAAMCC